MSQSRRRILFLNLHPGSQPHIEMAALMFGVPRSKVYEQERFLTMSVNTPSEKKYKKLVRRESETKLPELPRLDDIAAIVLTGSSFVAYPRLVEETGDYFIAFWKIRLMDYLQLAREKQLPILAVCFGAQILAQALGGTVSVMKNSTEELVEVGWTTVTMEPDAVFDPLFGFLPHKFVVAENHTDIVTHLPIGAKVALTNPFGIQGYTIGNHIWAVEFHPERPVDEVATYLNDSDNTKRVTRSRINVQENLELGKQHDPRLFTLFSRFLEIVDSRIT